MGLAVRRYAIPGREFCRTIWVSTAARELWAPRLQAIGVAWHAAERASVGRFRKAARQSIAPDQWPAFSAKAAEQGLTALALHQHADGGSYQARPAIATAGAPWSYTAVLTDTPATARAFMAAYRASDDAAIGDLLGFPPCCVEFFRKTWVDERWLDTTWPMVAAQATQLEVPQQRSGAVVGNILLRWLGVRFVPHLPCSFNCAGTRAFGEAFRSLLLESHAQEVAWMEELLDSPIEWSAWRGIAEVKHPLFKFIAKTDASPDRLVVQRAGSRYPELGETGNVFPYRKPGMCAPVSAPVTFHPSAALPATEWIDNGFSSLEAMMAAHEVIVRFYRDEVSADRALTVLDLGCGNARLVRQLSMHAVGVDVNPEAIARADKRCTAYGMTIEAFIDSVDRTVFDCVLLMPGRLIEMEDVDPAAAAKLRQWLRAHAKRVLVYAYGDWLTRYPGGFHGLCAVSGLSWTSRMEKFDHVGVALLDMEAEW